MNETIIFLLVSGFFLCMTGALIIGFLSAKDLWTWRNQRGKRIAWTLALIGVGFLIVFGVYVFKVSG